MGLSWSPLFEKKAIKSKSRFTRSKQQQQQHRTDVWNPEQETRRHFFCGQWWTCCSDNHLSVSHSFQFFWQQHGRNSVFFCPLLSLILARFTTGFNNLKNSYKFYPCFCPLSVCSFISFFLLKEMFEQANDYRKVDVQK